MKRHLIFLLLTLATINLFAKTPGGGNVNPLIEAKFQQEFGTSIKVSWQVIDDISVATFVEQGREKQVYYFSDGQVLGFGKVVDREALPEAARKSINERFNSAIIQSVYEFVSNDAPTRYFVYVYTERHFRIVAVNDFGDIQVYKKVGIKSLASR
jgi:hypothetical protein